MARELCRQSMLRLSPSTKHPSRSMAVGVEPLRPPTTYQQPRFGCYRGCAAGIGLAPEAQREVEALKEMQRQLQLAQQEAADQAAQFQRQAAQLQARGRASASTNSSWAEARRRHVKWKNCIGRTRSFALRCPISIISCRRKQSA